MSDAEPTGQRTLSQVGDAVLEAAARLFADRGFYRVSAADVAAAADVSSETVTSMFSDTAAMLLAVLTRRDDSSGAGLGMFEQPGGLEVLAAAAAMVRADSENPTAARLHATIVAEAMAADHPAHEWATVRYRWARSLYAGAVRRDIESGLIRADVDAEAVAAEFLAVMDGLQIQWLLNPDQVSLADQVDRYVARLIADIRV